MEKGKIEKEKTRENKTEENIKQIKKNTTQRLIEGFITKDNYEYCVLTKDEETQITNYLGKIDIKKDRYSKGTEGSIFKIEIKDKNNKTKEYIAAKKRYDNNPSNERNIHKGIENTINEHKNKTEIKIPKLKAVITLPGEEKFIIMEFVKGKTIYQLELEEIFKKRKVPISGLKSDIEAETAFFELLKLNQTNPNDCEKAQKTYTKEKQNIKLFSPEQGKKYISEIRKFLKSIHNKGIYHRDISNPRNVMVTESGEMYVIDFGKSLWTKNKNITEKNIYEKQEGENMVGIYPKDEEIIAQISGLTKSIEDTQQEREEKERKSKVKTIESDRSIVEYIQHIPKPRLKNKQEAIIIAKIKKQGETKKQIRLQDMEDANKEELIILLLAQSKENIPLVLNQIANRKNTQEENINKEKEKQKNIPRYTLSGGAASIERHKEYHQKNIEKIEKQLQKTKDIEDKIHYLEAIIKK